LGIIAAAAGGQAEISETMPMTWWQALILGIVEGLTEYLPVSSTGHLILAAWLLGLSDDPARKLAVDHFNIVIQAGAIAAVLGLYWSRVKQMGKGLMGRHPQGLRLAVNLLIAFVPAAVIGPVLSDGIDEYLFQPWPVVAALFLGAWLMLAVAFSQRIFQLEKRGRDLDHITWAMALLIGFGQCIAMWPGTSRSMMTIVAGLLVGLRAKAAAEFSFLLGLITLTAATAYSAHKGGAQMVQQVGVAALVIGFVAAAISAALAVKWFVGFLTRHGLAPFGWYRLVLAGVVALLLAGGLLTIG
jgi:undecaprenyl-diphosphatase